MGPLAVWGPLLAAGSWIAAPWGCVTGVVLSRIGHPWSGRCVRALSSSDRCGVVRRRLCGEKAGVRGHRGEGPRVLDEGEGAQEKVPRAGSEECRAGGKGRRRQGKAPRAGGEGSEPRGRGSRARAEAVRARGPAAAQLMRGRSLAVAGECRHRQTSGREAAPASNGAVRGRGRRPSAGQTIVLPVPASNGAGRGWYRPRPESPSRRSRRT